VSAQRIIPLLGAIALGFSLGRGVGSGRRAETRRAPVRASGLPMPFVERELPLDPMPAVDTAPGDVESWENVPDTVDWTQAAGHFVGGKRVGEWTWWHKNGEKSTQRGYENGKGQGTWTWWHDNGNRSKQGSYANHRATGVWRRWYGNGQLRSEGTQRRSRWHGRLTQWHPNGTVKSVRRYRNGRRLR
jgi:hypothetical protein